MQPARLPVPALLITLMSACSAQSVQRTGYETLQNIGEQQCEKDLSADCPARRSYDEYQRERKDLDVSR